MVSPTNRKGVRSVALSLIVCSLLAGLFFSFKSHQDSVDTVTQKLATITQKLDTVTQKLDTVTQKLDTVQRIVLPLVMRTNDGLRQPVDAAQRAAEQAELADAKVLPRGAPLASTKSPTCDHGLLQSLPPGLFELGMELFKTDERLQAVLAHTVTPQLVTLAGRKLCYVWSKSDSTVEMLSNEFGQEVYGLRNTLRPTIDGVMVDIGANIGTFSIFAAITTVDLQVLAFEPTPTTFFYFACNLYLNNVRRLTEAEWLQGEPGGVFAIHGAVGASEGTTVIRYSETRTQLATVGSLTPDMEGREDLKGWQSSSVKLYVPSKFLGDRTVQLLKMDCEGCEFGAIPAMRDLIMDKTKVVKFVGEFHLSLMEPGTKTAALKPDSTAVEETKSIMLARSCPVDLWNFSC